MATSTPESLSEQRRALADVALGRAHADLAVRGGCVVEVHTGVLLDADIAIKGDRIACVGDVSHTIGPETDEYDASGLYLVPGFIDCHLHVGSSQLAMTELARLLVAHGTAAISTCFYEAGMIGGYEAIRFFVEEARATPLKILFSPFATATCLGYGIAGNLERFEPGDLGRLLDFPECVEIREWSVYSEQIPVPVLRDVVEKARRRRLALAGHLEGQSGSVLQASAAVGVSSDHETTAAEEAIEKARLGIRVQIRQGSAAWDLAPVVRAITEHRLDARSFMFSTDEEEAHRLDALGHMDLKLRLAVAAGLAPVAAVQMATLNAAEYLKVSDDLGSLAPGRYAHVNVVADLASFQVRDVIADGQLVVQDGAYVGPLEAPEYPEAFRDTVRLHESFSASDLAVRVDGDLPETSVRVIGIREGSLLTEELIVAMPVVEGTIHADPARDLAKICVVDRHQASGRIGRGFIRGTGLGRGAFAATFNPGLMNLMIIGTNDDDMAVCATRLAELAGGAIAVVDGEIVAEISLPMFGIVCGRPAEQVAAEMHALEQAIRDRLGCTFEGLFTGVGFATLPISIPSLKLCDRGLVDVKRDGQRFVDLEVKEET